MRSWVTKGVERDIVDEFFCRLFGVGLAVLSARMQAEREASASGQPGLLFPDMPRRGRRQSYPWGEVTRPPP